MCCVVLQQWYQQQCYDVDDFDQWVDCWVGGVFVWVINGIVGYRGFVCFVVFVIEVVIFDVFFGVVLGVVVCGY